MRYRKKIHIAHGLLLQHDMGGSQICQHAELESFVLRREVAGVFAKNRPD
jgi:hypothetical protein